MTRAQTILLASCLLGCAGANQEADLACGDAPYLRLMNYCISAAMLCRQQSGTEFDCGNVCDPQIQDWKNRCQ